MTARTGQASDAEGSNPQCSVRPSTSQKKSCGNTCKAVSEEVEEENKVMGIEEAVEDEDASMRSEGEEGGDEKQPEFGEFGEFGEEEPQTPRRSVVNEEEDPNLAPGIEPKESDEGLSQDEGDQDKGEAGEPEGKERGDHGEAEEEGRGDHGEAEEEGAEARGTRAVLKVTDEMRDKHELTHCPYRS